MKTTRDELRKLLSGMDDAALVRQCVEAIRRARSYREDMDAQTVADLCFHECVLRQKSGLWDDACAEIARQNRESEAAARRALEYARRGKK